MHNGNIASWQHVKRPLALSVAPKWFMGVQGNTDSEWAFALFLDSLQNLGYDPDDERYATNGFGHANLRTAMLQTIKRINALVDAATNRSSSSSVGSAATTGGETPDKRSLLNFAVADGHSVVCSRYVSSVTDEAASLYFSSGTSWREGKGGGGFRMERRDRGRDIVLVASEPLTFERGEFYPFPLSSQHLIFLLHLPLHDNPFSISPCSLTEQITGSRSPPTAPSRSTNKPS